MKFAATSPEGSAAARNGGFFHSREHPGEMEDLCSFLLLPLLPCKLVVVALGAGLGVWGVVNLLEGYGSDNPAANAHVR